MASLQPLFHQPLSHTTWSIHSSTGGEGVGGEAFYSPGLSLKRADWSAALPVRAGTAQNVSSDDLSQRGGAEEYVFRLTPAPWKPRPSHTAEHTEAATRLTNVFVNLLVQ